MTEIQLLNWFISKKQDYIDLKISNIFAAHLLALSSKYPKHRELIAKAINPNETETVVRKPTKFVDTTPNLSKKDNFGECEGCNENLGLKKVPSGVLIIPSPDKPAPASLMPEEKFSSIEEIMTQYPTRTDLMRAAIQLNLNPHHKSSDRKIATDILEALNKE